nr:YEATS domain-containing protein 2 [Megalopta genalis]XP_033336603.1 YEATS domain-containing protein 2 [Megalopta genalis]XP_033336604.1 YEATS domain-containing protein 2 [Megalopta genalis]XP_033336605.1 YEATS domain-containing protein 2 [Megalopta genalis]XP_033336606.1 YEATS domain-containing protein 2 [Megalopta genalis]
MSALKDHDPDYGPSVANNEKHQRIYEENARSNTAKKITAIIEKEFSLEINTKEKEVLEIQERLHRASKALHFLRYVIVADFYNRKQCQSSQNGEARQTQIHPAIKQLIGKSPKECGNLLVSTKSTATAQSNADDLIASCPDDTCPSTVIVCPTTNPNSHQPEKGTSVNGSFLRKRNNDTGEQSRPKKIPRYIPPKSGVPESPCPSRGIRHKVRKRIIIGNISKWIPPEWREDAASHKWTMYVRGNKDNPDIDDFVGKVRFFLHPSYRPNDVVEVTIPPFCLSRRGWGEFPLRVQLHFKSTLDKPMDIIHHLKLDRTYTGLQTLGSETLVDIWIYAVPRNLKFVARSCSIDDTDKPEAKADAEIEVETGNDTRFKFNDNTNVNPKFQLGSTNGKSSAIVKLEEGESLQEIDEAFLNNERSRFYVDLDHDYCGSNRLEENLTIDHRLSLKKEIALKFRDSSTTSTIVDENFEQVKIKEETNSTEPSLSTKNGHNQNGTKALPSSCSKLQSNLCPLEISIPPLFESSNKHVLVLENNKTITVDIGISRNDDQTRKPSKDSTTKPKVNLTVSSRGISLLKKPSSKLSSQSETQPGLKLQFPKSILLNMNSNVPALKIAERGNLQDDYLSDAARRKSGLTEESASGSENRECTKELQLQSARQRITLGKDKHKLQSRKEFYDGAFRAIHCANIGTIDGLLRFIVRRMPMVTRDASDSDYKQLHPYACATEKEFFEYTVGKRTACEWSRAKTIRCLLKRKAFSQEEMWTVKEIIIWTRLHGYTPFRTNFSSDQVKGPKNLVDSTLSRTIFTCSEPEAFCKWLQIYPGRSYDQWFDSNSQQFYEHDIEVDIIDETSTKVGKNNLYINRGTYFNNENLLDPKIAVLEMETKSIPFHDFICETAREIGVKLNHEEILPSVVDCAASRAIMRAIECLVDDLVRMSLAKAWKRCDNEYPKMIVLDDVRGALLNREEFDIFTNQGLGSKYRRTSTD